MTLNEKIQKLSELEADDARYPFPSKGCRKIQEKYKAQTNLLDAYFDLYFMDIAGYASHRKGILRWTGEKISKALEDLSKSFFERRPEYKMIEHEITERDTPDLYNCLRIYEEMRDLLLEICLDLKK